MAPTVMTRTRKSLAWRSKRRNGRGKSPTASEQRELDDAQLHALLVNDGLLCRKEGELHITRRWELAMIRAAGLLILGGQDGHDLRVHVAMAIIDRYSQTLREADLARIVSVMLAVEVKALRASARD